MEIAVHEPVAYAEIMLELQKKLQDGRPGLHLSGCAMLHVLALASPSRRPEGKDRANHCAHLAAAIGAALV
jgi:hypothetical protein